MVSSAASKTLQNLRRAVLLRGGGGLTDGELLGAFLTRRDEACLEALVRRHGPMVLGVCRRVLRNAHDAEDAFQATFLVLVRKADSVVPREMVGNWLYGVAYRTALEARRAAARRGGKEKQVKHMPHPAVEPEEVTEQLTPLLDQELNRLPDKYREAVVLCDLRGKTRKEVARQLRLPEGTVSGRLTMARRMLAKRLSRHGLGLSGGAVAVMLSQAAASAAVPAALVASTMKAATLFAAGQAAATGLVSAKVAALTQGVLKTMLLTRLKIAMTLLLATAAIGSGAAMLLPETWADPPEKAKQEAKAKPDAKGADKPEKQKGDEPTIQGTWRVVSREKEGKETLDKQEKHLWVITSDTIIMKAGQKERRTAYKLDPAQKPSAIDLTPSEGPEKGQVFQGIYLLTGDSLKICFSGPGLARPIEFSTKEDEEIMLLVLTRDGHKAKP